MDSKALGRAATIDLRPEIKRAPRRRPSDVPTKQRFVLTSLAAVEAVFPANVSSALLSSSSSSFLSERRKSNLRAASRRENKRLRWDQVVLKCDKINFTRKQY